MPEPKLGGMSHVSLSVRDLEVSSRWYCEVLGFTVFERLEQDGFREHVLQHSTGMVLCLQQHTANAGEAFDERRTGMDHVAFKVTDRRELDGWTARLAALDVTNSSVADVPYGSVLCLRDPDRIQLELFYRPGH